MSALKFRNITASVDDPVETWPFEGILVVFGAYHVPPEQRKRLTGPPGGP